MAAQKLMGCFLVRKKCNIVLKEKMYVFGHTYFRAVIHMIRAKTFCYQFHQSIVEPSYKIIYVSIHYTIKRTKIWPLQKGTHYNAAQNLSVSKKHPFDFYCVFLSLKKCMSTVSCLKDMRMLMLLLVHRDFVMVNNTNMIQKN